VSYKSEGVGKLVFFFIGCLKDTRHIDLIRVTIGFAIEIAVFATIVSVRCSDQHDVRDAARFALSKRNGVGFTRPNHEIAFWSSRLMQRLPVLHQLSRKEEKETAWKIRKPRTLIVSVSELGSKNGFAETSMVGGCTD
jgi:hypothetical protein